MGVVVGIIGALLLIVIIVLAVLLYRSRREKNAKKVDYDKVGVEMRYKEPTQKEVYDDPDCPDNNGSIHIMPRPTSGYESNIPSGVESMAGYKDLELTGSQRGTLFPLNLN